MNLNEISPSSVRRYLYEYVLLALVACVVYLFLAFNSLNVFIRHELTKQQIEMIKTIDYNSATINQFLKEQNTTPKKGVKGF